jgi:hypothetical protein
MRVPELRPYFGIIAIRSRVHAGLRLSPAGDAAQNGCSAGHAAQTPADACNSSPDHRPSCGRRRSRPSSTWSNRLPPPAARLIQMATGSGKTFTAVNFVYRLIKHAKARGCSSWWTATTWAGRPSRSSTSSSPPTTGASSASCTTSSTCSPTCWMTRQQGAYHHHPAAVLDAAGRGGVRPGQRGESRCGRRAQAWSEQPPKGSALQPAPAG